ncbi:hypothetical protein L6452_21578 [Arctium lappa]|uniref:Uncharacterized protein n=1 Tax=Arctium lappa TaxID=4217 RepID=A0ACB9AXG3_ARCLA|nr:hypothetical protein L6452_21578 [Arctium lappa]
MQPKTVTHPSLIATANSILAGHDLHFRRPEWEECLDNTCAGDVRFLPTFPCGTNQFHFFPIKILQNHLFRLTKILPENQLSGVFLHALMYFTY